MAKKKINKQRIRIKSLKVEFDERHINPETGQIEISMTFDLVNDVNQIILTHKNQIMPVQSMVKGYLGETKFRTLSEIPTDKNDFSFNLISIGVPFHVIGKISEGEIEWELIPLNQIFALIGESKKIENKNWVQLIKYILAHPNYNSAQKVGLIVDSDLGNLKSYNNGTLPLDEGYYLPPNFEMIYASDRANDNILNQVMLNCHRMSKDILKIYIDCLRQSNQEIMEEKQNT